MEITSPRFPWATAKVTSKGQVTVPQPLRKLFKIEAGSELIFIPARDGIHIKVLPPAPPLTELVDALS